MTGMIAWPALHRLLRPRRGRLVAGCLLLGLQAAALLPVAWLVRDVFARQIPADDGSGVVRDGLGVIGLYLGSAVLSLAARRLILVAAFDCLADLRRSVLERLHDLPLAWHESRDVGALHSLQVQETERIEAGLPAVAQVAQAVIVGVPLAVVAVLVSPLLAGLVAVSLPIALATSSWLRGRTDAAIRRWVLEHRAYSQRVWLSLASAPLVRTLGVDESETDLERRAVGSLTERTLGKFWASAVAQVAQGTVAALVGGLVLVVGGLAVVRGALGPADLVAFYAVIALLVRAVTGGTGSLQQLAVVSAALGPMQAVLDDPATPPYRGTTAGEVDGALTARGLVFGHTDEPVLDGLDLDLAPGEWVALVGANGSGKSTLLRLLLGLARPWQGEVTMGGRPLDDLDVDLVRRRIGVVAQHPRLRPGTVRDNVAFGAEPEELDHLPWAAQVSGLDDAVRDLPGRLDAPVGGDGVLLSGGQRQCVAIARALVRRPRLLLLDEPTTHLDAGAVQGLLSGLAGIEPRPSVLLVTHDPAVAAMADRVVRLSGGRLLASDEAVR